MVIGFWISLFTLIMSIIIFLVNYFDKLYVEFSFKLICGLLMGISLFFIMFCGYYADMFVWGW